MFNLKTLAAGCLTAIGILVIAGGCVTSMVLFGQAMEQEMRPNSALLVFLGAVGVASLLIIVARAISKDPEE